MDAQLFTRGLQAGSGGGYVASVAPMLASGQGLGQATQPLYTTMNGHVASTHGAAGKSEPADRIRSILLCVF